MTRWKLVPVKPTEDMLRAGLEADAYGREDFHSWDDPQAVYKAMLDAAPVNPAQRQKLIAEFLESTGQYVTNDASRDAALNDAYAEGRKDEREEWVALTDADRERALNSMPDMLEGFMKTWGWLHFAKAIEDICREKNHGSDE